MDALDAVDDTNEGIALFLGGKIIGSILWSQKLTTRVSRGPAVSSFLTTMCTSVFGMDVTTY